VGGARLVLENVSKSFGAAAALSGVSLTADRGEVHAILGENGAGKSTLMKILSGALSPDEGRVLLDGEPFLPGDPMRARRAGVAMVYQELSLCPHLSVAENIVLGREPSSAGFLRRREIDAIARASLELLLGTHDGADPIDIHAPVQTLSPASRQLVEIARALAQEKCRVLILDEPTSSLSKEGAGKLFDVLRRLRSEGLAILYISHFLEEVQFIADTFTVLRDGKRVLSGDVKNIEMADLVHAMIGRKALELFPRSARSPGEVILELSDVAGTKKPISASLTLRRGEVLGIAGLVGAGRTELLRAVFGLDPIRRGVVRAGAYIGPASPARRLNQGIGFGSEDRKGEGLAMSLSIADNITLSKPPGLFGMLSRRGQREAAERWISELGIRCAGPSQPASDLSGGNQQKIALARLLHHEVDVFLLDEPTRGIDIGSKAQIYKLIDALACAGKAVLMVSSYLPELLGVCDRIAVMRRGELLPAKPAADLTEPDLMMEATGA
jgi:ribose transport system ATP-binding protein